MDSTPPDWSSIQEEVHCPLCAYDLRGIGEPRCPECGYTFDWPDLLDPTRRLHPYLFEHHPERNVRSFWRTAAGALLPRRFWRALQPAQPSRPRRLVLYWVLTLFVCYACVQLAVASRTGFLGYHEMKKILSLRAAALAGQIRVSSPAPQFGPVGSQITDPKLLQQYLDRYYPTGLTLEWLKWMGAMYADSWPATNIVLLPLTWPWLMFASLMIFQWSMRRSKVRAIHVLRCTVYSGGTLAWAGLGGLVVFWAFSGQMLFWPMGRTENVMKGILMALIGGLLLSMVYQLIVAYRRYMRFDHAVVTVLSALVIAILAPFTAYMFLLAVFR
jgi:hypothetical protein